MNGNLEQVLMAMLEARNQFKYKLSNFWQVLNLKWNIGAIFSELQTWLTQAVVFIPENSVCSWIGLDT